MPFSQSGDAITVYGALSGPDSRYTVTLDGSEPKQYVGVVASTDSSVALAFASNLGPGSHVLTLANSGEDGLGKVEIDYVLLWTNATTPSPRSVSR